MLRPDRVLVGGVTTLDACQSTSGANAYPIDNFEFRVDGAWAGSGNGCFVWYTAPAGGTRIENVTVVATNAFDAPTTATATLLVTMPSGPCLLLDSPSGMLETDASCQPCTHNALYWGGSPQCNTSPNTFSMAVSGGSFWPFAAGFASPSCVNFTVTPHVLRCTGSIQPGSTSPSNLYTAIGGTGGTNAVGTFEHWQVAAGGGFGQGGFGGWGGSPIRASFGSYLNFGNAASPNYQGGTYASRTGSTIEYTTLAFSMTLSGTSGTIVMPWRTNSHFPTFGEVTYTWTISKAWF